MKHHKLNSDLQRLDVKVANMKSSDREDIEDSRYHPEVHAGQSHDPPKNQKQRKIWGGATSDVNHAQYSMLMP